MGSAASARKKSPDEGEYKGEPEITVMVRTKTTCKRTRVVKHKKHQFRASEGGATIGSAATCDVTIDDESIAAKHATVSIVDDKVLFTCLGRSYHLIGQGVMSSGAHRLHKDQVVKMGACSLQVVDARIDPPASESKTKEIPEGEEKICYICFDDKCTEGDELISSPCVCGKVVHRFCLSRWISTRGSRLCSICRSKLPIEYTVSAPYLVLQVVRHMRGLQWVGEREYVLSFHSGCRPTNVVSIGGGEDCDLSLPDPSLSRVHSRIIFKDNKFMVEDVMSSAGTFLKVAEPFALEDDTPEQFKFGRTLVTIHIKIKHKRKTRWRI